MHLNAPDSITIKEISPGKRGIAQTMRAMRDIVRDAQKDFFIRDTATQIISRVPAKDYLGEVREVFNWVHQNIRYTLDPNAVELIHSPDQILRNRLGDCDDFTILIASLLDALGHPVAIKAVGEIPGELTHVYPITKIKDRWFALDATEDFPMGWEPRYADYKIIKI